MSEKVIVSKNVTPTTKRLGIVCMTVLATAAIVGAIIGTLTFEQASLITLPVITAVSALIDGGR